MRYLLPFRVMLVKCAISLVTKPVPDAQLVELLVRAHPWRLFAALRSDNDANAAQVHDMEVVMFIPRCPEDLVDGGCHQASKQDLKVFHF